MRNLWQWIKCHLLDVGHSNALAEQKGCYPLFPIVCDKCGELWYRVRPDRTGGAND